MFDGKIIIPLKWLICLPETKEKDMISMNLRVFPNYLLKNIGRSHWRQSRTEIARNTTLCKMLILTLLKSYPQAWCLAFVPSSCFPSFGVWTLLSHLFLWLRTSHLGESSCVVKIFCWPNEITWHCIHFWSWHILLIKKF